MPAPRLVLIDGSSYLYRAFHAAAADQRGRQADRRALFGVVNMLRSDPQAKPDYAAFRAGRAGTDLPVTRCARPTRRRGRRHRTT